MRWLWTALILCLTIYAPIELSRLIILTGVPLDELFELIILWSFYIVGLVIVYRLTKGR